MSNFINLLTITGKVLACFFGITFIIYWFNLDSKLVHKLFPVFNAYYDRLPRDRRL
ncbi:hypothetical protein Q5O24_02530 [Eubacteriaceae bacterium ES3]|nr:hypothetical protein Q5O24_02530 [Eubacteriaceae bacterium ES3]